MTKNCNMEIKSRAQFNLLMKELKLPMTICECGVAEGIFSTEIFGWNPDKLYLIDVWEHIASIEGCASFEKEWHDKNYELVKGKFGDKQNVIILKGLSHKMAKHIPDESLGLAYIDGDHTKEGVLVDAHTFWPKLVKGGIMAFHDAKNQSYGVEAAIHEFTKGIGINELPEDGDIGNMGAWIQKL